ncbi:MAG: FMN-binding protein [Oscillospiraceae bacterium]|nr:FMN-binding protein [Oscillospiraceae bacterium]
MFFKEKIKPPLVLTLICLITCGLLVAAYEATYVDNTGIITEKLQTGLTEVYGKFEDFEMLLNDDGTVRTYDGVTSILSDGKYTAFEITADGYSKGGLHVLVGLDENGSVKGVSIMTIGETPGLGTKVQDAGFLGQFSGVTFEQTTAKEDTEPVEAKAVWGSRVEIDSLERELAATATDSGNTFALDAVTGATFSSNGMYDAVKTALAAYNLMEGGAE